MLTPQTLQKLQLEQEKLDQFIRQKKNLTDADSKKSFIRIKIALLVEIGELANELKTFKHWKKEKEIDWAKAKEELIDCLHFYLSWANSFQIDFSDYEFKKLSPEPDENELLLAFFSETEKFSVNVSLKAAKLEIPAISDKGQITTSKKIAEKIREEIIRRSENQKCKGKVKKDGSIRWCHREWHINTAKKIKGEIEAQEGEKLITLSRIAVNIYPWIRKNSVNWKVIEKMGDNFLEGIEVEKNKASFYRWLIIFEELSQKMGMNEKDIKNTYMMKNKINWERQRGNY